MFQEKFGAVTAEVVLETSAGQVPVALVATGAWFLSGSHGCVCFVSHAEKNYGDASLHVWL